MIMSSFMRESTSAWSFFIFSGSFMSSLRRHRLPSHLRMSVMRPYL